MGELFIARVSRDFHRCATYVRCEVPAGQCYSGECDPLPLSIKATCQDFDRKFFKKGRIVEVERSNTDGRRFRVTRVLSDVNAVTCIGLDDDCDCPETHENAEVTFYLGPRYWNEEWSRRRMVAVLQDAFGMHFNEANRLLREDEGFWIRCRENQFARFMFYRNEAGIVNGFQDLRMQLDTGRRRAAKQVDVTTRVC